MPGFEELNTAVAAAGMACRAVGGELPGAREGVATSIATVYLFSCFLVLILPELLIMVVVVNKGHGWVKL